MKGTNIETKYRHSCYDVYRKFSDLSMIPVTPVTGHREITHFADSPEYSTYFGPLHAEGAVGRWRPSRRAGVPVSEVVLPCPDAAVHSAPNDTSKAPVQSASTLEDGDVSSHPRCFFSCF